MKKYIIAAVIAVVLLVLFLPVPKDTYDDGGTREFQALTYKIVKWNRLYEGDLCYNSTRFYFGKDARKSIEQLWWQINPDDMPIDGPGGVNPEGSEYTDVSVLRVEDDSYQVEYTADADWGSYTQRAVILRSEDDPEINVGDTVRVFHDGRMLETDPVQFADISNIYVIDTFDKWGVSLSFVGDCTGGKITVTQSTEKEIPDGELTTGNPFYLQAYCEGRWMSYQDYMQYLGYDYLQPEFFFTMEGIGIPLDGSIELDVNFDGTYGKLVPGTYRLTKDISITATDDDHSKDETRTYYVDFDIVQKERK